jgi:hypothetical protein
MVALTLTVLSATNAFSQSCESAVGARAQADVRLIVQSLYAGDIDVVLQYTHPAVVKLMGGPDATRQAVESAVALLKRSDMRIESLSFPSAATCLTGGGRQFIVVPTLSVIAAGDQRIESLNFQLGVLEPGGRGWTYVDGARVNAENVQLLLPGFPPDYRFPQIYRKRI